MDGSTSCNTRSARLSLLGLPLEIRLQIYNYLFRDADGAKLYLVRNAETVSCGHMAWRENAVLQRLRPQHLPHFLNPIMTCKRLMEEALPILCERMTINVDVDVDGHWARSHGGDHACGHERPRNILLEYARAPRYIVLRVFLSQIETDERWAEILGALRKKLGSVVDELNAMGPQRVASVTAYMECLPIFPVHRLRERYRFRRALACMEELEVLRGLQCPILVRGSFQEMILGSNHTQASEILEALWITTTAIRSRNRYEDEITFCLLI